MENREELPAHPITHQPTGAGIEVTLRGPESSTDRNIEDDASSGLQFLAGLDQIIVHQKPELLPRKDI